MRCPFTIFIWINMLIMGISFSQFKKNTCIYFNPFHTHLLRHSYCLKTSWNPRCSETNLANLICLHASALYALISILLNRYSWISYLNLFAMFILLKRAHASLGAMYSQGKYCFKWAHASGTSMSWTQ